MTVQVVRYTKEEMVYVRQIEDLFNKIHRSIGDDHAINMVMNLLWSIGEQHGWHKIGVPLTNLLEHVIEEMKKDMKQEVH